MESETLRNPPILCVTLPYQGHINPMMQFAKRLASKGLDVTIVCPSTIQPHNNSSINIECYEFSTDQIFQSFKERFASIQQSASDKLTQLIIQKKNTCGHDPFQVLVHDSLMPWAVDFGHQHGMRVASFFTQACSVSTIHYHVCLGKLKFPVEEGYNLSFLPSSIPITDVRDLPSDLYDKNHPGVSEFHSSQFSRIKDDDWVLFNTFLELEKEVVDWLSSSSHLKIMTIGPCVPSLYLDKRIANDRDYGISLIEPDKEACIEWLDTKYTDSVVYVSSGSIAEFMQYNINEIALGLLNSKQNFLWVLKDREKSKLPENFFEETADRGLVVNWCPQFKVLAHNAVGSFMTHCGWNSALEALCLGVPMMVMPIWMDQTTNAKFIVDVYKSGVRVKPHDKESVTSEDIAKCVIEVMVGTKREELKANALKWKKLALEAMSQGGSSDKNIDNFVTEILSLE